MASNKTHTLEALLKRKAELAAQCKIKEMQISEQTEYITDHMGAIALKSIIGNRLKHASEKKTEIIKFLVADIIDTAINIKNEPSKVKDKLVEFAKNAGLGVMDILFK